MGLKSGEKGPKAWYGKKHAACFRKQATLASVRNCVQLPAPTAEDPCATRPCSRNETAVFVDGNVLMMSVGGDVITFETLVDSMFNYIRWHAMVAGKLVVVVFDEPASITWAKRNEQMRRDAAKKSRKVTSSADISPPPLPADFTRAQLEAVPNLVDLRTDRRYKAAIFDEVIMRMYDRIVAVMKGWEKNGHDAGVLILDGVEVRGCELPPGEKRTPVMTGSDPKAVEAFSRTLAIGEGDIKLIELENKLRMQMAVDECYKDYKLALTWTVDTDSFMTMLLDTTKRRITPFPNNIHSLFCMRETAKRNLMGDGKACFLVCDTKMLEAQLQVHMWAEAKVEPTPEQSLQAMLALCASAAVCGCDFTSDVGQKGARFDHFWEIIPQFIAQEPEALATFGSVLSLEPIVARQACRGLLRVCYQASQHMETKPQGDPALSNRTYKKQASELWDVSESMLARAVWSAAYWSQHEFKADVDWGFEPDLSDAATSSREAA